MSALKLKNCVSWKIFEKNLDFFKKLSMMSKALYLEVTEPKHDWQHKLKHTLWVTDLVNSYLSKKIEKKTSVQKKSVKFLRYTNGFFSRQMTIYYLKVASYI